MVQLGVLIKPKVTDVKRYVRTVHIPIDLKGLEKKRNFNSVFKVHLFSNNEGMPSNPLIKKPFVIYCNEKSNKIISLDVSENNIEFTDKGFFICIEMVGELDDKILDKKSTLPAFRYTNKKSKDITAIPYIKGILLDWTRINITNHRMGNFNLAVGLTLTVREN